MSNELEYQHEYRKKNREKINAYWRQYRKDHPSTQQQKDEKKERSLKWNNEHRDEIRERNKVANIRRNELKKTVVETLYGGKCEKCIETELCCLEFHHLDPTQKEKATISTSQFKKWLKEGKDKNIMLVCSNCHKKIHNGVINI